MRSNDSAKFLAGVIEGFYGAPWSNSERFELFEWMVNGGLNTYLYAPKDDLKHRALWRELYPNDEMRVLGEVIRECKKRQLKFIYALSPGLDLAYSDDAELNLLTKRFEQMLSSGCENFALLFDDIPDAMREADKKRWGSFASAQSHIANTVFQWLRERLPEAQFVFCPTAYCERMASSKLGGEDYLATLGRELSPEIEVFWTGPEIISREITEEHVREVAKILRRKPVIWDNLHANDYDGRRFFCGPYAGRSSNLRNEVRGLMLNPNCEFPLNFLPLRTFAEFVNCPPTKNWNPREAYLSAIREWLPRFKKVGKPVALEDLILFGDCYYLPYEEGDEAEQLYQLARHVIETTCGHLAEKIVQLRERVQRLRDFCTSTTELRDRSLFHALNRRVWELREEMDLLERYLAFIAEPGASDGKFKSDFHLPGTYRGGFVARCQKLLIQQSDGTFHAASQND